MLLYHWFFEGVVMVGRMTEQREISTPEEFVEYIQTRGFKPEYGYRLLSIDKWKQVAEQIAERDNVNLYEAFKRWAQSIPVRM